MVLRSFVWTTVGFWMVDRRLAGEALDNWSPAPGTRAARGGATRLAQDAVHTTGRAMSDVQHTARAVERMASRVPRVSPVAQFLVNVLITGWWLLALKFPVLVFGPAAAVIGFAAVWQRLYVPIAIFAVLGLVLQYVAMTRPDLPRALNIFRTASRAGALIVLYFIWRAGEWVVFSSSGRDSAGYKVMIDINDRQVPLFDVSNYSVGGLLIAVGVLCIVGIVQTVRRPASVLS